MMSSVCSKPEPRIVKWEHGNVIWSDCPKVVVGHDDKILTVWTARVAQVISRPCTQQKAEEIRESVIRQFTEKVSLSGPEFLLVKDYSTFCVACSKMPKVWRQNG